MPTDPKKVTASSPLRRQRVAFRMLKTALNEYISSMGFEVAEDEGAVFLERWVIVDGKRRKVQDAVHASRGQHYKGLAQDYLLYFDLDGDGDDDDYVLSGDHFVWYLIARKWEASHPLAVSGARWQDANHVGFAEGMKTRPLEEFFSAAVVRQAKEFERMRAKAA